MATIKNKTRLASMRLIVKFLDVVLTGWSSWFKAAV